MAEVKEYMNDQNSTQYHQESMYNSLLKPQIKAYDAQYKFSRGDTKCPSDMHGARRNVQNAP